MTVRALRIGAALVSAALTLPPAGSDTVKVASRHKVRIAHRFNFKVTGTAASDGNSLHVLLNRGIKCRKTYASEGSVPARHIIIYQSQPAPRGKFSFAYSAFPTSTGNHYICAYLVNRAGKTLARASSKYVPKDH